MDAAMAVLSDVKPGNSMVQLMAGELRRVLSDRPAGFWAEHARFRLDARQSIQIAQAPGAVVTVVMFSSIRGSFGMLPVDFADALLSRHPVNGIALRDASCTGFLRPDAALGGSTAGLSDLLLRHARDMGALPVLTFGTSSGGFAALRLATMIGAFGAISFSGQTRLYAWDDRPSTSEQRIGLHYLTSIPEDERDVVPALRSSKGLSVWHVAGAGHEEDLRQQALLEGTPGVERIVLDGV